MNKKKFTRKTKQTADDNRKQTEDDNRQQTADSRQQTTTDDRRQTTDSSRDTRTRRICLQSDWAYWGCSGTDEEGGGGGGGRRGGSGRGGGRPTPGGPMGAEEVIADWWVGVSIPAVAIRGGPGGDTSYGLRHRKVTV